MNKCIEDGEGVGYDYYGASNMADEQFTLAQAKTALNQYMLDSFLELIKSGLPEKKPARLAGSGQRPTINLGWNQAIDQAEAQLRQAARSKYGQK